VEACVGVGSGAYAFSSWSINDPWLCSSSPKRSIKRERAAEQSKHVYVRFRFLLLSQRLQKFQA